MYRTEPFTQEELGSINRCREDILDFVFHTPHPLSFEDAKEGVDWLYREVLGLEPPTVLVLDSPMACQLAANLFHENDENQLGGQLDSQLDSQLRDQLDSQLKSQLDSQLWSQLESQLESQLDSQLWRQLRSQLDSQLESQLRRQLWNQLGSQLMSQLESQLERQLWRQLWSQLRSQLESQLRGQLRSQLKYFNYTAYAQFDDWFWVSYFIIYEEIGCTLPESFNHTLMEGLVRYLGSGIFMGLYYPKLAIISRYPTKIVRDVENRLHCEDGPAIVWGDGYELYFWHGVAVSEQLIMKPETITREDIVGEDNAEIRRCMMEKLEGRFAELLGLETIDIGSLNGQEVMLLRSKEKDDLAGDYLYFVRVMDTSTGCLYHLCVPECGDALEGVAWTFGLDKDEYKPLVET